MRKQHKLYLRSIAVTALILGCIGIFTVGVLVSYSQMRAQGFEDYRPPIEVTEEYIKILDFEIPIVNIF